MTMSMPLGLTCVDCGREFTAYSFPLDDDILCTPCLHARRRSAEAATKHFDPSRVDELTKAQARSLYAALVKEWPELVGPQQLTSELQEPHS